MLKLEAKACGSLGAGGSVDGEHGARDVGGHVARQENKGVGDILGLAHATQRNGGDDGLDDLFGQVGDHVGLSHAGGDGVDADAMGASSRESDWTIPLTANLDVG